MIKKYSEFISESFDKDLHGSIGEYIESLATEDDEIKNIVNQHIKESEPWIKISNAVNILPDLEQVNLLRRIEKHISGIQEDPIVTASTDINLLEESYGFGIMNTFFKCLTALGFKDNGPTNETPSEFLIFFKLSGVDSSKIEGVFKRFKSLQSISIDYSHPTMGLYFGIRNTGDFEYGYYYDDLVPIGSFKLNKSSFNKLKLSELKSTSGLKKMLVNYRLEDIILLGKIKLEMDKFNPGYFEQKMNPAVYDNRVISFGFYGVGKWDNGVLDQGELMNIKSNIKVYLSKFKWSEKIQISIVPQNFWVYINIKLK
jgi:hypothetical protein